MYNQSQNHVLQRLNRTDYLGSKKYMDFDIEQLLVFSFLSLCF